MLVKTFGSAVYGVDARTITIEVNVTAGAHYYLVGLPDSAVKESLQRIESAIKTNGYQMPRTKLVVNLAPANLRKSGAAFDLPIALGILGASEQLASPTVLQDFIFTGELSLDGLVRPVHGTLPIALRAGADGFRGLVVPWENASEAAMAEALPVYGVRHLAEVVVLLADPLRAQPVPATRPLTAHGPSTPGRADFADVKGQAFVKRALEVAAAGGHHLLMIGPPGAGKTMLAERLPSILPPLSPEEALESTKIHSACGKLPGNMALLTERPFRTPHPRISPVALVGGGNPPQPGEITLAHNGVLFLDEFAEFPRSALEALRQPLETSQVTISRAGISLDFPCRFMLVASMNPCPCGFYGHPHKPCSCSISAVQRYLRRISGPLLDRIDLQVEVAPLEAEELGFSEGSRAALRASGGQPAPEECSSSIRSRVLDARTLQSWRFSAYPGVFCNARLPTALLKENCLLQPEARLLLQSASGRLRLSARAYDRTCRVARTIADLGQAEIIGPEHVAEALGYRGLERLTG